MIQAGLLAWLLAGLPFRVGEKWLEDAAECRYLPRDFLHQPYSYGDSAGLTPDFPFNSGHLMPETKIGANVGDIVEE